MNTKIISYSFILNTLFIVSAAFFAFVTWQKHIDLKRFSILIYDGRAVSVNTEGQTVQAVLNKYGIALDKRDVISPPVTAPAPRGGKIRITRIEEKIENKDKIRPLKILKKTRLALNLRPVEIVKAEQTIVRTVTKSTYKDKVKQKSETLEEHSFTKTFYLLNILNSKGKIEKQYDLSKCKKLRMSATSYFPGDPLAWNDGTETLLGLKMQRGIVAVDPGVIRLRTRLFIPGYGYAYAADTGSAIKGKKIDLGFDNSEEDKNWIHKPVTVYILERSKSW